MVYRRALRKFTLILLVSLLAAMPDEARPEAPPLPAFERLSPAVAAPGDWPWWRGPALDGKSPDTRPAPVKWSETENVRWRAEVPGRGHATPIVVGPRVLVATADEEKETQSLLCFDRATGKLLWGTAAHTGGLEHRHKKNSHASPTPACDGERVFVPFLNRGAIRLTAFGLDGRMLWQRDTGAFETMHGYSSSPVLHGSFVVVTSDSAAGSYLAAVHRKSGEIIWKTPRNAVASFATPAVALVGGRKQLFLNGAETSAGYDPDTGRPLWTVQGPTQIMASTMAFGGGLVFASGGFPEKELLCIKPDGEGDISSSRIIWRTKKGVTYVPSALYLDGRLYIVTDGGVITCFEAADGREVWRGRLEGDFSASPTYSAGHIYVPNEAGVTHVLRPGDALDVVAANDLADGGFASPVICGERIYLRTNRYLYCIAAPAS